MCQLSCLGLMALKVFGMRAGIFLDSPTVSSRHAIICAPCLQHPNLHPACSLLKQWCLTACMHIPATLAQHCETLRPAPADVEGAGTAPFVQDLNSKNKVGAGGCLY